MANPLGGEEGPVRAEDLREEMDGVALPEEEDVPNPKGDGAVRVDEVNAEEVAEVGVDHDMVVAGTEVLLGHPVPLGYHLTDRRKWVENHRVLGHVRIDRAAGIHNRAPFVGVDNGDGKNDAGLVSDSRGATDPFPAKKLLEKKAGMAKRRSVVGLERRRGQPIGGQPVSRKRHLVAVSDDGEDAVVRAQDRLPEGEEAALRDPARHEVVGDVRKLRKPGGKVLEGAARVFRSSEMIFERNPKPGTNAVSRKFCIYPMFIGATE